MKLFRRFAARQDTRAHRAGRRAPRGAARPPEGAAQLPGAPGGLRRRWCWPCSSSCSSASSTCRCSSTTTTTRWPRTTASPSCPIIPNRGLILDRNGAVLAHNYAAYTLEITPNKVGRPGQPDQRAGAGGGDHARATASASASCSRKATISPACRSARGSTTRRWRASRSTSTAFPGVDIRARLFRHYPNGEVASHVLGYIGRLTQADLDRLEDEGVGGQLHRLGLHRQGRTRGALRARAARHHRLRGGRDRRQRARGAHAAQHACRCRATICCCRSMRACRTSRSGCSATGAERWWRSSLSTGGVLALVSKPGYRPQPVRRRHRSAELGGAQQLARPSAQQSRAAGRVSAGLDVQAVHGAGGARAGQAHAAATPSPTRAISCSAARRPPLPRLEDRRPRHGGPAQVDRGVLRHLLLRPGAGTGHRQHPQLHRPVRLRQAKTGIDIDGEVGGLLPSQDWKMRRFKQKWFVGDTISVGIGQGYNLATPHAARVRHLDPRQQRRGVPPAHRAPHPGQPDQRADQHRGRADRHRAAASPRTSSWCAMPWST